MATPPTCQLLSTFYSWLPWCSSLSSTSSSSSRNRSYTCLYPQNLSCTHSSLNVVQDGQCLIPGIHPKCICDSSRAKRVCVPASGVSPFGKQLLQFGSVSRGLCLQRKRVSQNKEQGRSQGQCSNKHSPRPRGALVSCIVCRLQSHSALWVSLLTLGFGPEASSTNGRPWNSVSTILATKNRD